MQSSTRHRMGRITRSLMSAARTSLAHTLAHSIPCPNRPRRGPLTEKLVNAFEPHRTSTDGGIGVGYLATLKRRRAICFTNTYSAVFVSDTGLYICRGSPIMIQSLDIITKTDHRRKRHGFTVMKHVIETLVRFPAPPCAVMSRALLRGSLAPTCVTVPLL